MRYVRLGAFVVLATAISCGGPTESDWQETEKLSHESDQSNEREPLQLTSAIPPSSRGLFEGVTAAVALKCNLHNFQIYTGYARPMGKNRRLTNNNFLDDQPALSADGSKVVFHRVKPKFNGICAIQTDGTGEYCIDSSSKDIEPSWSPDGTKIVFVSNRGGKNAIYIMNASGSEVTPLEATSLKESRQPRWSPDGAKILFSSNREGGWEIYTFDLATKSLKKITNSSGKATEAVWSPDGSKIAYASNRGRGWQIFMVNADGLDDVQVTDDPKGAREPSWAVNGRIFFTRQNNLFSVEPIPGATARSDYWGPRTAAPTECKFSNVKVMQPSVLPKTRQIPPNTFVVARDLRISWDSPKTPSDLPYADISMDLPAIQSAGNKILLHFAVEGAGDDVDRKGSFGIMKGGHFLELHRFMTDYGGRVAWLADLSAFRPLLTGRQTFRIQLGTQRGGYLISAALTFSQDENLETVKQVVPLLSDHWVGYGEGQNSQRVVPLSWASTTYPTSGSARLLTIITGHGDGPSTDECLGAEFCPRHHTVSLSSSGPTQKLIWRDDCASTKREVMLYDNTTGSRAGWCPGTYVIPWEQTLETLPKSSDLFGYQVVEPAGPGDYVDYTAYYVSSYLVYSDPISNTP